MLITTKSQSETEMFGKDFSAKLKGGDILLLSGDLGAGKTSLVKGIANGLGIKHEITSPTFTLMNLYKIPNPKSQILNLVHIDTYRLNNEKELIEIGVEDYLGEANTVCVIEWPEKIVGLLKHWVSMDATQHDFVKSNKRITSIALEHSDKPEERKIQIS